MQNSYTEQRLDEHALVLGGKNGLYRVETEHEILLCRGATKIRKDGWKLVAGDRVTVENNGDGTGFIRSIDPRSNSLIRPPIANIGLLVLVVAATSPKPAPYNLDKLTVIAEKAKIPVAIVVTKSELGGAEEIAAHFEGTPYPIFFVAEKGKVGSEPFFEYLKGKISVFCGASGVGKSTLLNYLFPEIDADVGELSEKIQRGKNTTRATTLYRVFRDTYVADSPGFTMLDTEMYCKLTREELPELFPEIRSVLGQCRFTKCGHTREEGCAVLTLVENGRISKERHESYCKLFWETKPSHLSK